MNIKYIYLFIKKGLKELIEVIFPTNCSVCETLIMPFEDEICTKCRHNLPEIISPIHFQNIENQLSKKFIFIDKVSFLFNYSKYGEIQHLIHKFKYKKPKKLGIILAKWHYNSTLGVLFEDKIDLIIVIPLHHKKLKLRGYNQLEFYAKTLAQLLNSEFSCNALLKVKETETQSKQNRVQRLENMKKSIILNPKINVDNKHILLVDDVVTTGATIESGLNALKHCKNIKVSVAALGVTLLN